MLGSAPGVPLSSAAWRKQGEASPPGWALTLRGFRAGDVGSRASAGAARWWEGATG